MEKFHIVGPTRLKGRVAASGAKNAALPALTASLLSDETLTLRRVPRVRDIRTLLKLLDHLGIGSEETDGVLVLRRERPDPEHDAPYDLVKTMRASVLVLGPLLAKEGHARVSLPGGCAIGVRPIDQHLKGLTALGADGPARPRLRGGPRRPAGGGALPVRHAHGHRHGERADGRHPRPRHHGAGELRPRARGGGPRQPAERHGRAHLRRRHGDDRHRRRRRPRRGRAHHHPRPDRGRDLSDRRAR